MSQASIRWIGGPVLKARARGPFRVHEALTIGDRGLLGEVVQLNDDEVVAQVYEDTTGLRPGDPVAGSGSPLSVSLGPGVLGRIFDGLLRPLADPSVHFLAGGVAGPRDVRIGFRPSVAAGDRVGPGMPIGDIDRPGPPLKCLTPPDLAGTVERIAGAGEYDEEETVCVLLDDGGTRHEVALSQRWPVRQPRPVRARLAPAAPMVTGQRILDNLFPVVRGGRAALPGGFGTGKTVLQERSNRSRVITLSQAATKSRTSFSAASSLA